MSRTNRNVKYTGKFREPSTHSQRKMGDTAITNRDKVRANVLPTANDDEYNSGNGSVSLRRLKNVCTVGDLSLGRSPEFNQYFIYRGDRCIWRHEDYLSGAVEVFLANLPKGATCEVGRVFVSITYKGKTIQVGRK